MAKKIFVLRSRIVKGERWLIDYVIRNPETGRESRHRNEFGLNQAPIEIRDQVARCLLKCLKKVVQDAPKTSTEQDAEREPAMGAVEALSFALRVKTSGPRVNTHKNYKSVVLFLSGWLKARSYEHLQITEFGKRQARAFFDWYVTRKTLRGATINNRLTHLRALWSELIDRDICQENPWKSIKPVRVEEKKRRPFSPEERYLVAREIERADYWLFRGVLLQYYCYIRPEELRRLKFRAFDFAKGLVKVESFEAKKWKTRWATIPESVMPYFLDGHFEKFPANYFVFGVTGSPRDGFQMAPNTRQASKSVAYRRHKRILEILKSDGRLTNIAGLTWYSWKDTGISAHARQTSPLATRDQAGHEDFAMTLTYYQQERINPEYRGLNHDLFK